MIKLNIFSKFRFEGKKLDTMNKPSLIATAVGSLPHTNSDEGVDLIFECFKDMPLFPQMANVNKLEDMTSQVLQNMPGIVYDKKNNKFFVDNESDEFFLALEDFYLDYDAIVGGDFTNLEKYKISKPYTSTFDKFLSKIKNNQTLSFVKGQIVGPFSFSTSLTDKNNVSVFYDDTLRDIAIKTLTLKALWQIEEIKKTNKNITPVIFMDEPSLSHIGTCAFLTIDINMVKNILNDMANIFKSYGAVTAIHCCGKMPWDMLTSTNVDILNFDAYSYSDNLELYSNYISNFLDKGGIIAWGIVPTLDVNELENVNLEILDNKFQNVVLKLEKKGINKDVLIKQSIFTPSCGCGGLSKELAVKACKLTSKFVEKIKEKYSEKVS